MSVQMVEMVGNVKNAVLLVLLVPLVRFVLLVQYDVAQGKSRFVSLIGSIGLIG
jgi:hypothetical protein